MDKQDDSVPNYFAFYGLETQFGLDLAKLKRLFLLKSRETHPDFFTLASAKEQADAMTQSALNNEAYKVLADVHLRTEHILRLFGLLADGEKDELSPNFLMEMMDINEQLMDAAFDPLARQQVEKEVQAQLDALKAQEIPLMQAFDAQENSELLKKIKEIYFRRKYLLRIKEKLDTFASR